MQKGETVTIAKAGKPVAVLGPVPMTARRVRGMLKGQIKLGPEFDEPLPPEFLAHFEGEDEAVARYAYSPLVPG